MPDQTIVPGSPEHDAAMLARAADVTIEISDQTTGIKHTWKPEDFAAIEKAKKEGQQPQQQQQAAPENSTANIAPKPANVPDKFYDPKTGAVNHDAWAKEIEYRATQKAQQSQQQQATKSAVDTAREAVVAAQAKLSAATTDEAKAAAQAEVNAAQAAYFTASTAPAPQVPQQEQQQSTSGALEAAMNAAAEEFQKTGAVSEQHIAALEAAGIPRDMTASYVAGMNAQRDSLYAIVGGKDEYAKMSEWAAANQTPEQLAAYNAAVTNADINTVRGAIANLSQLYKAAVGTTGTRVEGDTSNKGPAVEMYQSEAEMLKDMRDPRYLKGDPAFHAEVDKKLAASQKAGVNLGVQVRMGEFVY